MWSRPLPVLALSFLLGAVVWWALARVIWRVSRALFGVGS